MVGVAQPEDIDEVTCEMGEVGRGIPPLMEVRRSDGSRGAEERVIGQQEVGVCGEYVHDGRMIRVAPVKPYRHKDVRNRGRYGQEAMRLEEVGGGAVVVGEGVRAGGEGGEVVEKGEEVLPDYPFQAVVGVGKGSFSGGSQGGVDEPSRGGGDHSLAECVCRYGL